MVKGEVTWKEREGDWIHDDYSGKSTIDVKEGSANAPKLYDAAGDVIVIRRKIGF